MLEEEFEWLKKSEVLYYSVEKKGNVSSQFKHNPWSMKCHQQQLQRMKENAKHRNQYSILFYQWQFSVCVPISNCHFSINLKLAIHCNIFFVQPVG